MISTKPHSTEYPKFQVGDRCRIADLLGFPLTGKPGALQLKINLDVIDQKNGTRAYFFLPLWIYRSMRHDEHMRITRDAGSEKGIHVWRVESTDGNNYGDFPDQLL